MKKGLLLLLLLAISSIFYGQKENEHKQNKYLTISIGKGYDDALASASNIPALGIGYEQDILKHLSFGVRLFYYYRTFADYPDIQTSDNGMPIIDIIVKNSNGPFVTKEDIKKIKDVGIKDLEYNNVTKLLTIPVIFKLKYYPINYHKHSLGIGLGAAFSYNSYNWPRDGFPIKRLLLNDGTEYNYIYLTQNTEFRNIFNFQDYISIIYFYCLDDLDFGVHFVEYGRFFGGQHNLEVSLITRLKI